MYALFKPYMGEKNARELAEAMANTWKSTFVDWYNAVHANEELQSYLVSNVPSALQFLVYQLVNEYISSVLLTRNETAGMVAYKYATQGLEMHVIQEVMAITTKIIAYRIPQFTAMAGETVINADNVIRVVDRYVLSYPPASRSNGGKLVTKAINTIPSQYAGTTSFAPYAPVDEALQRELQEVEALTR